MKLRLFFLCVATILLTLLPFLAIGQHVNDSSIGVVDAILFSMLVFVFWCVAVFVGFCLGRADAEEQKKYL